MPSSANHQGNIDDGRTATSTGRIRHRSPSHRDCKSSTVFVFNLLLIAERSLCHPLEVDEAHDLVHIEFTAWGEDKIAVRPQVSGVQTLILRVGNLCRAML
jgi:hypothetical protein